MPAYIVAGISEMKDPELMAKYGEAAGPTVAAHGGKLVSRADIEKLDGDWDAFAGVIIEFPNTEAAKAWYNSPEYQEVLPMRFQAVQSTLLLYAGE